MRQLKLLTLLFLFVPSFCISQNFEVYDIPRVYERSEYIIGLIDTVAGEKRIVSFFDDYLDGICDTATCEWKMVIVRDTLIHREVDTLKLIEELLKFRGDNRVSILKYVRYGNIQKEDYDNDYYYLADVSLQVYALYLIHFLVFPKDENNFIPLLEKRKSKMSKFDRIRAKICRDCYIWSESLTNKNDATYFICFNSTKGKMVRDAYKIYENWFRLVEEIGLDEIRTQKIYPLSLSKELNWSKL